MTPCKPSVTMRLLDVLELTGKDEACELLGTLVRVEMEEKDVVGALSAVAPDCGCGSEGADMSAIV